MSTYILMSKLVKKTGFSICCTCKPSHTRTHCFIYPPSLFTYSFCHTVIPVLSGDREKSLVILLCHTDPFSHNPEEMKEMLRKMKGGQKYKEDRTKMLDSHSLALAQESKPITKTVDFCGRNE